MKLSRLIEDLQKTLNDDGDREVHLSAEADYPSTHPVARVWVAVDKQLVVIAEDGCTIDDPQHDHDGIWWSAADEMGEMAREARETAPLARAPRGQVD